MSVIAARQRAAARAERIARRLTPEEFSSAMLGRILALLTLVAWAGGLVIGFETALTVLTCIGIVVMLAGLKWPGVGLLGLGMLTTLDTLIRGFLASDSFLPFNTFNYLLLIAMVWFLPVLVRINDVHSRLMQALLLVLGLELFFSDAKISGIMHILNAFIIFAMIAYYARAEHIDHAVYWMGIVSGLIAAVGGAVYYLQIDTLAYLNPNAWAKFPVTGIIMACLAFPVAGKFRFGRLALMLLAVVCFAWTFLSGSRGNMLIGGFGLLFLLVWERRFSWKIFMSALMVGGMVVLSAFFVEQQTYAISRLTKIFDPRYNLNQVTSGRANIAELGLQLFLRNPLGVGTGNFMSEISTVSDFSDSAMAAHSGWIKVLAENGVPGILLLGAFVASFAVVGLLRRNREAFLIGMLTSSILAVAFISTEFQGKNLWFLAGAAAVMLHREHYREIVAKAGALLVRRRPRAVRDWRGQREPGD